MDAEESDSFGLLSKAWYNLRLSVRCPSRVPTWDAIILTASSPQQAYLYQWHLDRAKRRGIIEPSTIALAVPDPDGFRIGSGGATLHALRYLAQRLPNSRSQLEASNFKAETRVPSNENQSMVAFDMDYLSRMSVLLVHAGGDSKRVPWANPMGKTFLPLPFLADDDPDGLVPSLFDHILAISSCAVQEFKEKGGLFIMTGDVLPLFNFSDAFTPEDGACVVTVPASLEMAANHGVILASPVDAIIERSSGMSFLRQECNLELAVDLLQKPTTNKLLDSGVVRSDSTVLLDTGIFAVRGEAWKDLLKLALDNIDPVSVLLCQRKEVSLYEEMAGAWVPARHDWLKTRPLGTKLIQALSSQRLFSYCARKLSFFHFGTSLEVLNHLAKAYGQRAGLRHMIIAGENNSYGISSSAVIVSCEIHDKVFVGEESLIFGCAFNNVVHVGSHCIVIGIHVQSSAAVISYWDRGPSSLLVPDWHCLWEVPLCGTECRVTLCCSVDDNPKVSLSKMGTFCGKPWKAFLHDICVEEEEVWPDKSNEEKDLWNAKLFPIVPPYEGILFAMWMMGVLKGNCHNILSAWRRCERVSLAGLHGCIDFKKLCNESSYHQSRISLGLAEASLTCEFLDRDLSKLCIQILEGLNAGAEACKSLMAFCPDPEAVSSLKVPVSRVYQARLDLCKASGDGLAASMLENNVWDAVMMETAVAVGQKKVTSIPSQPFVMFCVSKARIELPVRVDIVGGWSDTPPWSLERAGAVLNIAILLDGSAPIGAEFEVMSDSGVLIIDDSGHHLHIDDPTGIFPPFDHDDRFRLVKSALLVTGLAGTSISWQGGLQIKTWANVPRGSGLGTSSILAGAVVKGILRIMGGDDSDENVSSLVLLLEQLMGTGGGWQDQIGGLYPGIKYTTSNGGCPLKLKVEPVSVSPTTQRQLEERMLVFFTGQVRLAHQVLQNIVRRYLQRDAILISSIEKLVDLAQKSQEAFIGGELDELGRIMRKAWLLHQELDPYCSNTFVDTIFKQVDSWACGYKLVGAGGGGFGILMAKDKEAALYVKEILTGLSVQVFNWSLCEQILVSF